MSDLVEDLRRLALDDVACPAHCDTEIEAANEIERLRAALEEIAECEIGFEGQVARKALNPDERG